MGTRPRYGAHGFEETEVFQRALDVLEWAHAVDRVLWQRKRALNVQLQRAAVSAVANVGEGGTELSAADKRRFYRYALRSTGECASLVFGAERLGLLPAAELEAGKQALLRLRVNLLGILRSPRRRP